MYRRPLAETARGLVALAGNRLRRRPLNLTLELTRRCNARCDYCNHWKEQRQHELDASGFAAVVARFQPFSVTLCGGEPLLRKDALEIAAAVRAVPGWRYTSIITNGWFLDERRIAALSSLDQVNVSLNFPDARQDDDRKLPGLFDRLSRAVPALAARGCNVQLNTVLMDENLDDAVAIARLAAAWGARVTYTLYSELPADNHGHLIGPNRIGRLKEVVAALKREPNVSNTHWYLDTLPAWVAGESITGCTAGKQTLHLSPTGQIRPCAELPAAGPWQTYDPVAAAPVTCARCFQACRGEVEAPITLKRVLASLRG